MWGNTSNQKVYNNTVIVKAQKDKAYCEPLVTGIYLSNYIHTGSVNNSYYENFINVILGKEENRCPGIYGLNVLRFTEAVYESAQSGRPVKI